MSRFLLFHSPKLIILLGFLRFCSPNSNHNLNPNKKCELFLFHPCHGIKTVLSVIQINHESTLPCIMRRTSVQSISNQNEVAFIPQGLFTSFNLGESSAHEVFFNTFGISYINLATYRKFAISPESLQLRL